MSGPDKITNCLFFRPLWYVAHALQLSAQSQNKNKWPNNKNDVITDLGGEGDFPMFLFGPRLTAYLLSGPHHDATSHPVATLREYPF